MKKNKNFVKRNRCPYCTAPCDFATQIQGKDSPRPGCISFCFMCCQPLTWNEKMKLIKFDLNSIPDLFERSRIRALGWKIERYWEDNPDKDGRREKYLKIFDERHNV